MSHTPHSLVRTFLLCWIGLVGFSGVATSQEPSAAVADVNALNHKILHDLLVEGDASTLESHTLDDFLVIAPGGRVENKLQAVAGVSSLDVKSIELSDERSIERDDTIILIGKLVADGTMQPLAARGKSRVMLSAGICGLWQGVADEGTAGAVFRRCNAVQGPQTPAPFGFGVAGPSAARRTLQ